MEEEEVKKKEVEGFIKEVRQQNTVIRMKKWITILDGGKRKI